MLRAVLRRSSLARHSMERNNFIDKLHPFMMKLRENLEEVSEYLDKGEPVPYEETVPYVYEGPVAELEAWSHAIPENPEEHQYLIDRWDTLINEVERTRLEYFDSIYGTRTYYQPSMPMQERISIDTIYDKRVNPNKWSRLTQYESIQPTKQVNLKPVLMRKEIDLEYNRTHLFNEKLKQIKSTVYDACGRVYADYYQYVKPTAMEQEDMGVIVQYMELENDRYFTNHHLGKDRLVESTIDDAVKRMSRAEFVVFMPVSTSSNLYWYSTAAQSIVITRFEDIQKSNLISEIISKINLIGEEATSGKQELPSASKNSLASDSLPYKKVISLTALRDYFLNFNDKTSYDVVKYLQFNDLEQNSIKQIDVEADKYMIVELSIADAYFTVVIDLHSGLVLNQYFISPQPSSCVLSQSKIYRVVGSQKFKTVMVLDLSVASTELSAGKQSSQENFDKSNQKFKSSMNSSRNSEDNFESSGEDPKSHKHRNQPQLKFTDIHHSLDNTGSIVKHMNTQKLQQNIDHSISLVSMQGNSLLIIKDRLKLDLLCYNDTARPDRYSIIDDKVTAVRSSMTYIEGYTASMKYAVGVDAKGFYIWRCERDTDKVMDGLDRDNMRPGEIGGEGRVTEGLQIRLPEEIEIRQIVFLERFLAISVASKDKNTDQIVCNRVANQILMTKTRQ